MLDISAVRVFFASWAIAPCDCGGASSRQLHGFSIGCSMTCSHMPVNTPRVLNLPRCKFRRVCLTRRLSTCCFHCCYMSCCAGMRFALLVRLGHGSVFSKDGMCGLFLCLKWNDIVSKVQSCGTIWMQVCIDCNMPTGTYLFTIPLVIPPVYFAWPNHSHGGL